MELIALIIVIVTQAANLATVDGTVGAAETTASQSNVSGASDDPVTGNGGGRLGDGEGER